MEDRMDEAGVLTRVCGGLRGISPVAAVVAAFALLATAAPATAGMRTVWPDQLVPADKQTADATIRDPDRILLAAGTFSGQFYAPVSLPAGVRITKLEYLNKEDNSGGLSTTAVELKRSRHAEGQRTALWFRAENTADGISIDFEKISETVPDAGGRQVLPGYRHWVFVYLNGPSQVGSIRIYYR